MPSRLELISSSFPLKGHGFRRLLPHRLLHDTELCSSFPRPLSFLRYQWSRDRIPGELEFPEWEGRTRQADLLVYFHRILKLKPSLRDYPTCQQSVHVRSGTYLTDLLLSTFLFPGSRRCRTSMQLSVRLISLDLVSSRR